MTKLNTLIKCVNMPFVDRFILKFEVKDFLTANVKNTWANNFFMSFHLLALFVACIRAQNDHKML